MTKYNDSVTFYRAACLCNVQKKKKTDDGTPSQIRVRVSCVMPIALYTKTDLTVNRTDFRRPVLL